MAGIFPSYQIVQPSYMMPEVVMQYSQASGFANLLAGGKLMPRLGEGDLYAYIKKIQLRTRVKAGQVAGNTLPNASLTASMASTPSYLVRCRAEYDHHDQRASGNWGVSLPEAQRLGMRQGIFQQIRSMSLFGMPSDAYGGIVNTPGATTVNLPADSNGATTVSTYDNGQMATWLLQQIGAAKTRMNQIGMGCSVRILAPQRVLSAWNYTGIVQLTQYQRVGAGVESISGVVEAVAGWNGDDVEFYADDTLQGAGSGSADLVLLVIPEVKRPVGTPINTNVFAELQPGTDATVMQLCDMDAPREISCPLPGGAIDVLSELRATAGWGVRGEAVTVMTLPY